MQLQHERFVMTTIARDERAERDRRRRIAAQEVSPIKTASSIIGQWPSPASVVRPVRTWTFKDICNQRSRPIVYDCLAQEASTSHGTSTQSSNPGTPALDTTALSPHAMSKRWAPPPLPNYSLPTTAPPGLVLRAAPSPPRPYAAGGGEGRRGNSWAADAVAAATVGRRELDNLLVQRIQGVRRLA
jgi:hypothetical protein